MTKYREKKYICGKYMEVCVYPVYEVIKGKKRRVGRTPDAQKALNDHNRKRKLTRLLNTNFTEDDIKIELTYSDESCPHSDEEAQRMLTNFLRRLKRYRKKNALPDLKYIVVTEKGKKSGRYHHHCVLSGGMLAKDIRDIWGHGIIRLTQLEPGEKGLDALAQYLTKNLTNGAVEENQKAWHASRNLKQPVERTNDSRISKKKAREMSENQECRDIFEAMYPDYFFYECQSFYNDVNGQYYLSISMNEKPKPEIHTNGRKLNAAKRH